MATGSSPFRCKGIIYRGTRAFFEAQSAGGFERLVAAVEDPTLRTFFTQPFLSASWYDVLPVAALIQIEARVLGLALVEYLKRRTTFQADQDIGGVHHFLLRMASPGMVAPRLTKLLTQVFDFGSAKGEAVGERHWRYEFRGWPLVLHDWYTTAFDVYTRRALTLAGAKQIEVTLSPLVDRSTDRGVPVGTIKAEVRWS